MSVLRKHANDLDLRLGAGVRARLQVVQQLRAPQHDVGHELAGVEKPHQHFEPLDPAAVLAVCEREQPQGVVIQFGGQTPLKLAATLEEAGIRILGTPYGAIDLAEDRERFGKLAASIGVRCPEWGIASTAKAKQLGGKTMVGPVDIPTVGRFAVIADPQGAAFAIFQALPRK